MAVPSADRTGPDHQRAVARHRPGAADRVGTDGQELDAWLLASSAEAVGRVADSPRAR